MRNTFISYARDTQTLVLGLAEDIKGLGHAVWLDQELSGGQSWWDQILGQIRDCDVFLFALTPDSLKSTACSREYEYAYALGKPIIPVLLSDGVSMNLLPDALSQIQAVDYRDSSDKTATLDIGKALNTVQLLESLPDPLPPAPEVPLSYLGGLASRVDAPDLSYEEQTALLVDIKGSLRDQATAEDGRTLLNRLKERPDLLAKIEDEIDEILGSQSGVTAATGSAPGKNGLGPVKVAAGISIPVIALVIWMSAGNDTVPEPAADPIVRSFQASSNSVNSGEPVTLSWAAANAISVILHPSLGVYEPTGEFTDTPATSTTYQLIAINEDADQAQSSIDVTVTPVDRPSAVVATGFAGFLGDALNGNLTASGVVFDGSTNVAAKLPALEDALGDISYGTTVRVTNVVTDDSVDVRIIDSGNADASRIINLSRSAFSSIANTTAGTVRVSVQILDN